MALNEGDMFQSRALVIGVVVLLVGVAFAPTSAAAQTEDPLLSVETQNATEVTESSAWLQGNLTLLNESLESAEVYFKYWSQGDPANSTTIEASELDQEGDFKAHVTGLGNDTTYVYQAFAEANGTLANGSEVAFTTATEEIVLEVETEAAANITNSSATLRGNLSALDENASNTTVWFQYWESGDMPTKEVTEPIEVNNTGEFSVDIARLETSETYAYSAHAQTNATDGNYTADDRGAVLQFTTFADELSVETLEPTDVTNTSATLNGRLDGVNNSSNTNLSFTYWVKGDPGNTTTIAAGSLSEPEEFNAGATGLQNNTTYVYFAQAKANGVSASGTNVSFTTGAPDETPSYSGGEPFGQWLSATIHEYMGSNEIDGPFGQWVTTIVHANNPGQGEGQPTNPSEKDEASTTPQDHSDADKEPEHRNDTDNSEGVMETPNTEEDSPDRSSSRDKDVGRDENPGNAPDHAGSDKKADEDADKDEEDDQGDEQKDKAENKDEGDNNRGQENGSPGKSGDNHGPDKGRNDGHPGNGQDHEKGQGPP